MSSAGGHLVKFDYESFRWGREHLSDSEPAWKDLLEVFESINRYGVIAEKRNNFQKWREGKIKKPAVGGQQIMNSIIETELRKKIGWEEQVSVLEARLLENLEGNAKERKEAYWTMDFKKGLIGVEVSFNNAGALSQNLLRLSVMSESENKKKSEMIRVGILITAAENLKQWSTMDSTVLTFESTKRVFPAMNFNIPTPILLIGLESKDTDGSNWDKSPLFPTKKELKEKFGIDELSPYAKLSATEKSYWDDIIDSTDLD
jgi:hypothetical protein